MNMVMTDGHKTC